MSNAASRKRKAEQIGADDANDTNDADEGAVAIPHLPAPVWGRVLDFMPYGEVRSALLVGKHVAVEAVKYVQTLNIMKGGQMYIPATRRFTNVETVNILCLLEDTGERDEEGDAIHHISPETANRIPTFISSFAKVQIVFLGGFLFEFGEMRRVRYEPSACNGPDNHEEVFRGLGSSLFAACQTGALRRDILLVGLGWGLYDVWPCSGKSPCRRCRNCVQCLPVSHVLIASIKNRFPCLNMDDLWKILTSRPGLQSVLKSISEDVLSKVVSNKISQMDDLSTSINGELQDKFARKGKG